jgi:hypothetical protein
LEALVVALFIAGLVPQTTFRITNAALPAVDRARQHLKTEINKLRMKPTAPVTDNSVRSIHMAAELRSRLASMSQKDRLESIHHSINAGDDSVVAAVLEGALILTGLSEIEREHVRETWRRKRLPDECKRIDQLEKDAVHLNRGGTLLMSYQRKMADQTIVTAAKASSEALSRSRVLLVNWVGRSQPPCRYFSASGHPSPSQIGLEIAYSWPM